jgi:hypothetical protein
MCSMLHMIYKNTLRGNSHEVKSKVYKNTLHGFIFSAKKRGKLRMFKNEI